MERNLMNKLTEEVNQELTHIQKPYSLEEIYKKYLSGNYNAELLLQHTLKKVEEQEERIKDLENSVYMLERTVYDRED